MKTIYWCGSEESFAEVLKASEKAEALVLAHSGKPQAGWLDEMLAALPPIWRHEGSTAVIEINGPVVQGDAGVMRLFGVLGYHNIEMAVNAAVGDEKTKALLFHINSPGGDVAGITEMTEALEKASAKVPSRVHTSNLMASAGYWMASAIKGEISAGPTAIVGSIGVLRVHMEESKFLEKMGVTATVLRSGEYKAETNPYEPLSEGAKQRAEAQLADVHALFRAQVAKGRPNLKADQLAEVTKGQTFLGKRSVQAGLTDRIGSFDLALKLLDNRKHHSQNPSNSKGTAMNFTAEQIAKIQAGELTFEAALAENQAAEAAAVAAAKVAAEVEAAKAAAEAAAAAAAKDLSAVDLLKAQLATAQAERDAARDELVTLKATQGSKVEHYDGLLAIARTEIGRMSIALGGNAAAAETMDGATAVTEHARITATFVEKFPVGGVAHGTAAPVEKPKVALPDAFAYRLPNKSL